MGISNGALISIHALALIVILGITIVPSVNASEETRIILTIVGDPVIDLDTTDRLIRASVLIENYNPTDGAYYMQAIQSSTGKILKETEIFVKDRDNDMWGTEIAGILDESLISKNGKPVLGNYQLKVYTEFGSNSASVTFSIIKSSEQKHVTPAPVNEESKVLDTEEETTIDVPESETETETEKETEEVAETENEMVVETENVSEKEKIVAEQVPSNGESNEEIPGWIKNIALWYGQGNVTEDEFINAIKFLINQGIIEV